MRNKVFLYCFLSLLSSYVYAQNNEYRFDSYYDWSGTASDNPLIFKIINHSSNTFSIIDECLFQIPPNSRFKKLRGRWYISFDEGSNWNLFFHRKEKTTGPWTNDSNKRQIVWEKTECKDLGRDIYCFQYKPYNNVNNPIVVDDSTVLYYVDWDEPVYYFTYKDGIIAMQTIGCFPALYYRQDKAHLKECLFSNTIRPD